MSRPSRRRRRLWWQGAVSAAVSAVAVLLAQHTAGAVFSSTTANGGDTVSSASSFCTAPGTRTENPSADTSVYQSNPTTNYGLTGTVGTIASAGAVARVLLTFPLTSPGSFCTITAATLKLYVTTTTAAEPIAVMQIDATTSWTEAAVTWNLRPTGLSATKVVTNAPATTGQWQQWDVGTIAKALSTGTNNGFQVQNDAEGTSNAVVYWDSREGTNKPQLVIAWG